MISSRLRLIGTSLDNIIERRILANPSDISLSGRMSYFDKEHNKIQISGVYAYPTSLTNRSYSCKLLLSKSHEHNFSPIFFKSVGSF